MSWDAFNLQIRSLKDIFRSHKAGLFKGYFSVEFQCDHQCSQHICLQKSSNYLAWIFQDIFKGAILPQGIDIFGKAVKPPSMDSSRSRNITSPKNLQGPSNFQAWIFKDIFRKSIEPQGTDGFFEEYFKKDLQDQISKRFLWNIFWRAHRPQILVF